MKRAAIGAKAPCARFINPPLATLVDKVTIAERWAERFKKIADDAYLINAASAIIDGEVVVPAADGTTDFSVLQNELKGKSKKIVMVAFRYAIAPRAAGHDEASTPNVRASRKERPRVGLMVRDGASRLTMRATFGP